MASLFRWSAAKAYAIPSPRMEETLCTTAPPRPKRRPGLRHRNQDNYGPLAVPRKGQTVALTPQNAAAHYKLVLRYEHNEGLALRAVGNDLTILQNGKALTSCALQPNHYFVTGNNRHNSLGSRVQGFLPEDLVLGKAVPAWLSFGPSADFLHKVRWGRPFHSVSQGWGPSAPVFNQNPAVRNQARRGFG